ncbi:hypothetical protein AERO9A_320224 [Aeromonas salmonicida]|nr:hypothetical protein AERO9A_320224 [Aeromonas salmonicida]
MPTSSPITHWMACCDTPRHCIFYVKLYLIDLMIYLSRFAKVPDGRGELSCSGNNAPHVRDNKH